MATNKKQKNRKQALINRARKRLSFTQNQNYGTMFGAVPTNVIVEKVEEEIQKKDIKAEREKEAKKLASTLLEIEVFGNSPIKFALNKAKKKIMGYSEEEKETMELSEQFANMTDFTSLKKSLQYTGIQAAQSALQIAENYASYAIDRYCTLQEDYMSKQAISNVRKTINVAQSGLGNIIGSAVTGAQVGGIGGAVGGAVIGAASFGLNTYLNYQQRMSSYYQQLNSTNFQTDFSASRLGLINNSRGTEN